MKKIELKNLSKKYEKEIIKDLNLEISPGEFCVLLGPSGCGKSTLLEIIAGLEKQNKGQILFDGKDVSNLLPSKRKISMIFQDYALYPNMNVFENVEFYFKIKKVKKFIRKIEVEKALKIVGLLELSKRYPHELSGGQRQRVAIARALVTKPDVFLMDEPLSNLDTNLKNDLRREILSIHKKINSTTIYVTHDKNEALNMADKIVIINEGIIQQVGSCKDVLYKPNNLFVFKFLHTNANVLKKEEFLEIFKKSISDKTKYVAIKSEDIYFSNDGYKVKIKDIKLEEDRKVFYLENNIIFKASTSIDYKIGDVIKIDIKRVFEFSKNEYSL